MNEQQLESLRIKELIAYNVMYVTYFGLFIMFVYLWPEPPARIFIIVIALLIFIQAMVRWARKGKVSSIIPIFQEVQEYEKEVLGEEWERGRSRDILDGLLRAVIFMFLATNLFKWDDPVLFEGKVLGYIFSVFALLNVSDFFYVRKIDDYYYAQGYKSFKKVALLFIVLYAILATVSFTQ